MLNKIYSKVLKFIKENIIFIIILFCFHLVITFPVPYYIHTAGGIIDISDKVTIEDSYKPKGSFNLAYVTEIRGNVLTYLMSYVVPGWDLINRDEINLDNETYEEMDFRNKILLDEANQNAVIVAYKAADKYVNITNNENYVIYIDPKAETNLKISDQIISANGEEINNIEDYIKVVQNCNVGDTIKLKVKDKDGNKQNKSIKVYQDDKNKLTGIYFITKYTYTTDPKVTFNFGETESGPSGGLMMSLSIYNKLITEDLTKGKKIVGTGTIDIDGNVGEISGIEYKIKGAVKEKADIFLAPSGDNYEKAIKLKKEENYDIEILEVTTFNDALNYLDSI